MSVTLTDLSAKQLWYSPLVNSRIGDIYPWHFPLIDHLAFISPFNRKSLSRLIQKKLELNNLFFTDSGRSALTLAIKNALKKNKREVLVTAFSCPSVVDAVISAGGTPVFIDINRNAGINLFSLRKGISSHTAAVIVTNTYGIVDDLDRLQKLCRLNQVLLINDLAQVPINYNSKARACGDIVTFSFGPEKHIFALGGGALLVNNIELITRVKKNLPNQSIAISAVFKILLKRYRYYLFFLLHKLVPQLFRLSSARCHSDVESAELIIPRLMHRVQLASLYLKLSFSLSTYKVIQTNIKTLQTSLAKTSQLHINEKFNSPVLYFTILVERHSRYQIAARLDNAGIASVWNYFPLYYYDAYKQIKVISRNTTESVWPCVLSIPVRVNLAKMRKHITVITKTPNNNDN